MSYLLTLMSSQGPYPALNEQFVKQLPDRIRNDWKMLTNACVDGIWTKEYQRITTRTPQKGGKGVASQQDVDKIVGESFFNLPFKSPYAQNTCFIFADCVLQHCQGRVQKKEVLAKISEKLCNAKKVNKKHL